MSALDHVLRAQLPWRHDAAKTECGRDADDVGSALTYDQARAKFRELGQQRAIMTSCVTCFQTANARGHNTWERRPSAVIDREVSTVRYWMRNEPDSRFDRELRAIAALVEAHRDEFDGFLEGLERTSDLASRRRARNEKRA